MRTTIYLIRHGTTDSNMTGRFQGSQDIPLNERGLKQAAYLGERFREVPLDGICTSPLIRTLQTTESLKRYHAVEPVIVQDLIELSGGDLEGHTGEENLKSFPEEMENMSKRPALFQAPNGESTRTVYERFTTAVDRIAEENRGKTIAVVSHGFTIQTYINYAKGIPFADMERFIVGNTSVSCFVYDDAGRIEIVFLDDTSHLPEDLKFDIAPNFMNK